jgi:hypothetical protein
MSTSRRAFLHFFLAGTGLTVPAPAMLGRGRHAPSRPANREVREAELELVESVEGFSLRAQKYSVRFQQAQIPQLEVSQDGLKLFRLPSISGLWSPEGKEQLSTVVAGKLQKLAQDHYELVVTAQSSLWTDRIFRWSFYPDHIEFRQQARGPGAIGRCFFFANGISGNWDNGSSPGIWSNTSIFGDQYFSPAVNLGDQSYFTIAISQSVGILEDNPPSAGYHPNEWTGDFAPPPLCLVFRKAGNWAAVGIGTRPGSYLFNALEYTGSRYAGASFYVNYLGYRTASEGFESPTAVLHFAGSEFEALGAYVLWLDAKGFSTSRRFPNARWHHLPIFCGWGEQENQTRLHPGVPHDFCTQENYEKWIADLEAKGLPFGTIIIDDKWQKYYGTFAVDERKWPDLKGFISRQQAKGRHVLLWVPAYHSEGLDPSVCVLDGGRPIAGDVTNPRYEDMLRSRILHLVRDLGVDGFKEDWIGGVTRRPGVKMHQPIIGIEFERRFQFILHDESHRWKPDALIETQTPNPLFRESSDVLRLNDIWYGARDLTSTMRRRAAIAHAAGWDLVDCDDASSTDLEEWWNYMQAQLALGVPSLYVVSRMKSTLEDVPPHMWTDLAVLWKDYIAKLAP